MRGRRWNMATVFPCEHCGKELRADSYARVHTAQCPHCGLPVNIPATVQHTRHGKHKVLYVPAHGHTGETTHASGYTAADGAPVRAGWAEITAGWVSLLIGVALGALFPRLVLVYAPFIVGAMVMGVRLVLGSRPLAGLALLVLPSIAAPWIIVRGAHRPPAPPAAESVTSAVVQPAKPAEARPEPAPVPPPAPKEVPPPVEVLNAGFEEGVASWILQADRVSLLPSGREAYAGTTADGRGRVGQQGWNRPSRLEIPRRTAHRSSRKVIPGHIRHVRRVAARA